MMKDVNSHFSSPRILVLAAALLLSAALTVVALAAQFADPAPPPKDPPPEAERTASGLAALVLAEGTGEFHPDPNVPVEQQKPDGGSPQP